MEPERTSPTNETRLLIHNVRLPYSTDSRSPSEPNADCLWEVECTRDIVSSIKPQSSTSNRFQEKPHSGKWLIIDGEGGLMLPSLCHSHLHLDKCFILDRCGALERGDFSEAMKATAKAKASFPADREDLLMRARRLVRDSVECGVTAIRAHVEVDAIVGYACLDVACIVKEEFKHSCYLQIAVFAQEPLFSDTMGATPGPNYEYLSNAMKYDSVEVIGSAPYVEPTLDHAKRNITLILDLAQSNSLLVDFHLDYNLDPTTPPLIYEVINQLNTSPNPCPRRITIGHGTRLQLLSSDEWDDLATQMKPLPINLVSLPQSDLYMQGRSEAAKPLGPPRGTLRVPHLASQYGVQVAMGVNNVQNAFTPQGSLDPLSLCTLGVAIFQCIAMGDIETLLRSVTLTAKAAIGVRSCADGLRPRLGDPADFVIVHGTRTLRDAVLNPAYDRTTVYKGVVVARRRTERWFFE